MITISEVKNTLNMYCDLRSRLSKQIPELPEGKLYFKHEHGVARAYTRVDGNEKYLGTKHFGLIQSLAQRQELEKAIVSLDANISLLTTLLESYSDLYDLMPSLQPLIQDESVGHAKGSKALSKRQLSTIIDEWATNHNSNTDYFMEGKKHKTSDGNYVRSKSELAIYEFLLSHNISFRYEEPLDLGTKTKIPDFTLIRSDGKKFIWEHFGLLSDEEYYRRAINTMYLYMDYGFLPYDNIIISYDYEDGSINMEYIDRVLRALGFID